MFHVEEIRLEQIHGGTGIVDRSAFDTEMVFIRPAEKLKQLRDENRNFIIRTTEPLLNLFIGNYLMGHIKSKHGKRSEEHTSELQSRFDFVCLLLHEYKKTR